MRSHAKTGPFLPPSRLIARDGEIDHDMANNNMDGRSEAGSECKYLNIIPYTTKLFLHHTEYSLEYISPFDPNTCYSNVFLL